MSSRIVLKVRLGPLVSFEVSGDNCNELNEALAGYENLNVTLDDMCGDLADRVYPEGEEGEISDCEEK
ncbi:MAG: hypothetical protein OEV42_03895 [Deltaproteobacteria bacterium]|nr:hypothetical protein [Deltaproteobacteria bacterium]